ncbi:MAG TPA: SPOR domain-containing protein, partial [Azospirillaceae bacterium]|nr:SPOR domain-containing protein [Azospirillaceae bacterium]
QARLDVFANSAAAEDDWAAIVKRNPRLTAGLSPLYVPNMRRSDGKEFVALLATGFNSPNEAARFCDALRSARRTCIVKEPRR